MATAMEKLKGDKRRIAAQMKADIARGVGHKQVAELLNLVLNPDPEADPVIAEWDSVEWCRFLISGGKHFDDFAKSVRQFDDATTCGLVWTSNFVAYRCRTCGISPCMSICAECFHGGDHEGHDFNMFRSQAGGACDCGDLSVMRGQGFCSLHGPNRPRRHSIPSDLLPMAEIVIPKLVFRLLLYLRDQYRHEMVQTYLVSIPDAEPVLGLLHDLCKMGGAMRAVMTRALTNPQVYKSLTKDFPDCNEAQKSFIARTQSQYESALDTLSIPVVDRELQKIPSLSRKLVHKTFLDELVFWTVKFEFPQKIVTFLLNMLPDNNYKEPFTQTFVQHYGRMAMSLSNAMESDKLANRVVHISVQLFSNEDLAYKMTQDMQLMHVLICSVSSLVKKSLIDNPMTGQMQSPPNKHRVIDCEHMVMKKHCYWPIISDLTNVLSHKAVVDKFFSDPLLLALWASFLSNFMGMNLNTRQMKQHVEFEPNTYSVAFSAELEACAAPMWQLALHCKDSTTQHYTIAMLKSSCEALREWLSVINMRGMPHPGQVSFHLPLLRNYALFLSQAVIKQELCLDDYIPSHHFLEQLLVFPLQIQAMLSEIFCSMWVRNGVQIKCQAMTYVQCHFCASMADLDIFFLQVCAAKLNQDKFVSMVMDRFKVLPWLTLDPDYTSGQNLSSPGFSRYCCLDVEQEKAMLEGALKLLLMLLTIKTHRGVSDEDLLREEIVSLLCMHDRTHSQLTDHIPEKTGLVSAHENFEQVLNEVAKYHDPLSETGGLQQGHYSPKSNVWCNEFNPVHVMLRAMQRKDFQSAMDRYTTAMKQAGKWSGSIDPWPPFQPLTPASPAFQGLYQLLHTKTLHGIIFSILFKAIKTQAVSDTALYFCVALLDMSLQTAPQSGSNKVSVPEVVSDLDFTNWFPDHLILGNLVHQIKAVEVPCRRPTAASSGRTSKARSAVANTENLLQQILTEEVFSLAGPAVGGSIHFDTVAVFDSSDEEEEEVVEEEEVEEEEEGVDVLEEMDHDEVEEDGEDEDEDDEDEDEDETDGETEMEIVHETGVSAHSMIDAIMDEVSTHVFHDDDDSDSGDETESVEPMIHSGGAAAGGEASTTDAPSTSKDASPNTSSPKKQDVPTKTVPVGESILTLLLKLYTRFSDKNAAYVLPGMRSKAAKLEGSFVGGGAEYIERFLDRAAGMHEGVRKILAEHSSSHAPSGRRTEPKNDGDTAEERRKKAREAQQKLIAKLAAEQMKFLQTTVTPAEEEEEVTVPAPEESSDSTDRPESPSKKQATEAPPKDHYDCVICGQNAPSTAERPMGYVVLLQASSVLGHQSQILGPQQLPTNDEQELSKVGKCHQEQSRRLKELQECFDRIGCYYAVSIGWQGGVHIQTCGHTLHLDCHDSYVKSLKRNEFQSPHLKVKKGEYECPLCRQLANSVMPCLPGKEESSQALVLAHRCHADIVKELSRIVSLPQLPKYGMTTMYMAAVDVFCKDIAREGRCKEGQSMSGETFPELCSTTRMNLEMDLVGRGGKLVTTAGNSVPKRSCLGSLMQAVNQMTRVSCFGPLSQLWSILTKGELGESPPKIEVPALLMDPITILVEIVVSLPFPVSKEHFCSVVRVVYSLLYIQALAVVSCRFPAEEREAWRQSGKSSQGNITQTNLDSLMSQVIGLLSQTKLYEDPKMFEGIAICQSIWSPQTVETSIEQYCLPFLRCAALLQHHIFKEDLLPCMYEEVEFEILANYLNLCSWPPRDEKQQSPYSARCVQFVHEKPSELISLWCKQLMKVVKKKPAKAKSLLLYSPIYFPPRLLQLPKSYDDIFRYYRVKKCQACCSQPSRPAVCLVCGTLVCLRSTCCQMQNQWEGVQHSMLCGSGTGIYLDVNYSGTLIIRGERMCRWASVYLDSHGEEDQDLRRGKPLYLCQKRYQFLEHLWKSHSLNHMCKGWNWHVGMQ